MAANPPDPDLRILLIHRYLHPDKSRNHMQYPIFQVSRKNIRGFTFFIYLICYLQPIKKNNS